MGKAGSAAAVQQEVNLQPHASRAAGSSGSTKAASAKRSGLAKAFAAGTVALIFVIMIMWILARGADKHFDDTAPRADTYDGYTCGLPYGATVGVSHGVPAFSNCNGSYASMVSSTSVIGCRVAAGPLIAVNADLCKDGTESRTVFIYTGMKWQCVEYARRFLVAVVGVTFGDVDGAADIWPLNQTEVVFNATPGTAGGKPPLSPFESHGNGVSAMVPRLGDLLIYARQGGSDDMPYGHVAAVVDVDLVAQRVFLGEENWSNRQWSGFLANYSRALGYGVNATTGAVTVIDTDAYIILGWKRVM
jgi:hypothetical protein